MRKTLSYLTSQFSVSSAIFIFVFFIAQEANAQCGIAGHAGPGGPYTPNNTWQTTTAPGSGTFQTFNINASYIYSFELTPATTSLGNDWDMTLSSSSAIINYDNINTPIPNSYSGGIACPSTTRPSSAVWDATYSGTLLVNVNTWTTGNACAGYVPTQLSATLRTGNVSRPVTRARVWAVPRMLTHLLPRRLLFPTLLRVGGTIKI